MNTTACQTRSYEAKVDDVSRPRRTVTAKINTSVVDRYETVICPAGGDFRSFRNAPAVLWEHGQDPTRGRVPVAHCSSIKYRSGEDDILAVSQFKSDPYSQEIFNDYADGTLTAWSLDFLPDQGAASRPTSEELRSRPDWSAAKTVYRKWELTGYSAVSYPGNPEALSVAIARGLWVPDDVRAMVESSGKSGGSTVDIDEDGKGKPDSDSDEDDRVKRYIKHEDGKYNVYSEAGKLLGSHASKADAVKQLQAIEANKHAKDRAFDAECYATLLDHNIRTIFPLLMEMQSRIIRDMIALDKGQV